MVVAACVCLCLWGEARSSQAADADGLVRQGIELRRGGQDLEALALFQQAYELDASPKALAQIGLAEQALGRWTAAHRHLREALQKPRDSWIQKNRATIEGAVRVIEARVGRLSVSGSPSGAEVRVDGERVGQLPLLEPVLVPAGRVALEVSAPGYLSIVRASTVSVGGLTRENINLQALSQAGEAKVADQKAIPNTAAPPPSEDRPRSHQESPTAVTPAEQVQSTPHEGGTWRPVVTAGALGLAALALAGGIVEHVVWQKNVHSFENTAGCDPRVSGRGGPACSGFYEAGDRAMLIAFTAYGLTAGLVAVAAIVHFTSPSDESRRTTVACAMAAPALGVGCTFRF